MHRPSTALGALVALCAFLFLVVPPARAATFTPDSTIDADDASPGDGVCATTDGACTLRAAISEANALAGKDDIALLAATYELDPLLGPIAISEDLEIRGESLTSTTVQTTTNFTVQDVIVISGAAVTLRAFTLVGQISGDNGIIDNQGFLVVADAYVASASSRRFPGIRNRQSLIVTNSTIEGHFGDFSGTAAIRNEGNLTVLGSVITGHAGAFGGALVWSDGDVFVNDSVFTTFSGTAFFNVGTLDATRSEFDGFVNDDFGCFAVGGGIVNRGTMTLTSASVAGIAHCGGGALANFGMATIIGSTLGGAADNSGGALLNEGAIVMRNSTVSASYTNGEVGGIHNRGDGTIEMHGCTVTDNSGGQFFTSAGGIRGTNIALGHTILAGNHGTPADCDGTLLSLGHNLIGDTTGCAVTGDTATDVVNVDPRLGPLAANGGPTFTHALLAGSPARDAGAPTGGAGTDACEANDQRGVPRPQGDACDIGAFEAMSCGDGTVGPGEECDDGNVADGDCCSSTCTSQAADGTACNDGNACTLADTCHAGVCGSTATRECGVCADCDAKGGCVARVLTTCHQPTKTVSGQLEIVDARTAKLTWKWAEGEATARSEFGDPTTSGPMAFCVFDESGAARRVAFATETRTGHCGRRQCWRSASKSTYQYKDSAETPNGLDAISLRSGKDGKARVTVNAHGAGLDLPPLPAALPLRVQLQAANGECWEASYVDRTTKQNDAAHLKAKAFQP